MFALQVDRFQLLAVKQISILPDLYSHLTWPISKLGANTHVPASRLLTAEGFAEVFSFQNLNTQRCGAIRIFDWERHGLFQLQLKWCHVVDLSPN